MEEQTEAQTALARTETQAGRVVGIEWRVAAGTAARVVVVAAAAVAAVVVVVAVEVDIDIVVVVVVVDVVAVVAVVAEGRIDGWLRAGKLQHARLVSGQEGQC